MILESMLQRLYSSLQKGPSLNARPHNSRQRIDLSQLADFQSVSVDAILPSLLGKARKITLPANAPLFVKPDFPQEEWSDEQRKRSKDTDRQNSLLAKLQDIAIDAQDYFNDHGEDALFIGFPIISLPAAEAANKRFSKTARILAPAAFIPITLAVQKGAKRAITIKAAGEGADLIIPNPALLAWLEQQTGEELPEMFEDDTGEDPTREYADILDFVVKSLDLDPQSKVGIDVTIEPIRRAEALPDQATILPSAVLGLFPMTNAGLLRDTKRMMEDEDKLEGPIRAFLHREALQVNEGEMPEEVADVSAAAQAASQRPFDQEFFIAPVDPSQARTAQVARSASALVIHGPPGTGKSQTITNIIGDHLARGQRVLFVCDKRTALDVVKYRLDHCGLGHLCGVIHDPSRDRRPLYMGLRDRMDRLVESEPLPNPEEAQNQVNKHLAALDRELKGYFRLLHESYPGTRSFHELVGAWLSFKRLTTGRVQLDPKQLPDITLELLESHKTDIGEILHRAREARLSVNPFFGSLAITLDSLLQQSTAQLRSRFANIESLASELDACRFSVASIASTPPQPDGADTDSEESTETAETPADAPATPPVDAGNETTPPPEQPAPTELLVLQLHPEAPLEDQATARAALAAELEGLAEENDHQSLLSHYAQLAPDKLEQTRKELKAFISERLEQVNQDLDRELVLLLSGQLPSIANARRHASELQAYLETCDGFFSFLQFGKKKAATEALKPFGLPLTPESARRALAFLTGVDVRWILSDLLNRLRGRSELALVDDDTLRPSISLLARCNRLIELCEREESAPQSEESEYPSLKSVLLEQIAAAPSPDQLRQLAASFRVSAARASHIQKLHTTLLRDEVLTPEAIQNFCGRLRANETALPTAIAWSQYVYSIEGLLRLRHGLDQLPDNLKHAVESMALLEFERDDALNELSCVALQNAIRRAIDQHPDLLHIDSARINAAFDEYGQRLQEKQIIARQYIAHHWEKVQRQRLLASTGSRLSSDGANLRSRLFIRGKRSLKLRQMIAAGEANPDGDPLFDLCPVWMASPSTVAQIFPREPLFDVVVFDEASQCRLEEALPILLRAKRVVIAGDPKQLPPTRFFESGIIESDDSEAETAEELVAQQMSEAEDLLSAALNLDVEEAFLDVHYRSQNEALIGFSNQNYYHRRLQPIPGHPKHKALDTPIKLIHVDGVYDDRANNAEAIAICELIAALLDDPHPPSIGVASFNINQRDLIIDLLNDKANDDPLFARRYADARNRRGSDSFEGLFVRNLENVQGDERDHIIISTTFGTDPDGKFRRNFGALSRNGGERRLNVLVTRARSAIHIFTSIPREEYRADSDPESQSLGRRHLYAYLRYAEQVSAEFDNYQSYLENLKADTHAVCSVQDSSYPSQLAQELGRELRDKQQIGSHIHWGNEGFCVDLALTHPSLPADVTVGILTDFNRYRKTPDPIAWEHFRTEMLRSQGWQIHRVWSPIVAREPEEAINLINDLHEEILAKIPIDDDLEVDDPDQNEVQS